MDGWRIVIIMPVKLKASTKQYQKDSNGRMTNRWKWIHFTVSGTKTDELLQMYKSTPKKRNVIKRELDKRGVELD